jgi:heme exporter protein A
VALRDVTLAAHRGEVLALFGPNGAGKTTLLRILATLIRPTRGSALLDGADLAGRDSRAAARRRIGFLAHQTMLYDRLTARENLVFFAQMHGVSGAEARAGLLLDQVGLGGRGEDRVGDLSRGMQQRLAIARALLHRPDLLLLDEPFTGLDPAGSRFLAEVLRDFASGGGTVVFSTHDLGAGLSLCHRAAVLVRGAVGLLSTGDDLRPAVFLPAYEAAAAARGPGG